MFLRLFFTKNNNTFSLGKDPNGVVNNVNLGSNILLDESSVSQFLDVKGTLNFEKYPQSDVSKFISFYLDNKVLILTGTIDACNETVLDNTCSQMSAVIGGDTEQEFFIEKYLKVGEYHESEIYRFFGIVRAFRRQFLGDNGFKFTLEIEMVEPRFEKLNYVNGEITPIIKTLNPKIQGFKFPIIFPLKFGTNGNNLIIENNGNSQVVPNLTFANAGQNFGIKTDKGVFSFELDIIDGQTLTLDINNQVALLGDFDMSGYATGWEALTLNIGENTWTVQGEGFSDLSLLTVSFFEKYHTL